MQALIILALAIGATFSTGPEQVPTSLCYDPLLGPSMIIYSDCGDVQAEPDRERSRGSNQPNGQQIEQPVEQTNEVPVDGLSEQPSEELTEQPPEQETEELVDQAPVELSDDPVEQVTDQSVEHPGEDSDGERQHCNKGSGNGAEGCDLGNHPEKGNNDEGGDKHPQNNKNEKLKVEKQKCNKGSGNGAEGCDPGNHPENGNNDEGGDRHPQNSKKDKKH